MELLWIELRDFRNHQETHMDLSSGVTTLVGPNGEGKTNLLEGMSFLLSLSSPRVATDVPLIRDGSTSGYLRGETKGAEGRTLIEIEIRREGANRIQLNRSPIRRRRDLRKHVRSVFFGPHDLRIVQGDPGARRDFLDEVLRSLWPQKESLITAYDRVLRQRNRLLKEWGSAGRPPALDTWNEELSVAGSALIREREEALGRIAAPVDAEFRELAGYGLVLEYVPNAVEGGEERVFREQLARREQDELTRRTTLVGPHRDELRISVRDLVARGFASHGEAWGAALSLRLGMAAAVTAEFREPPLLLVDDPFSALDPRRRDRVSEGLQGRGQVVLSVADEHDIPPASSGIWDVRAGSVTARGERAAQ